MRSRKLRRLTASQPVLEQELLSQIQRGRRDQKPSEMQETIVLKWATVMASWSCAPTACALLVDSIREVIGQFLEQDQDTLASGIEASDKPGYRCLLATAAL